MLALLGTALLAAAALLVLGAAADVVGDRRAVARSLAFLRGEASVVGADGSFRDRVGLPAVRRLAAVGRRLTPQGASARLLRQLDLAGPASWDLQRVYAAKVVCGALGAVLALLVAGADGPGSVLVAAVGAAAGFLLPNLLVHERGTRRQLQIQKSLPDALDLLTVSVEAGMGFDAAIGNVARHTQGPLSGEFHRVLQEMQLQGRSGAFRALGERTTVAELRSFVSSLVQADALGIPIGQVLREQAKEMRLKRRQRAEEQAMKVPVKVLFPMVVCILPVLFVVVLAPAGMEIAQSLKDGG